MARLPRVAIVGLGLVGGSLARALTAAGYDVTGIDWPLVVRRALRRRAIAKGATRTEAAAAADLVVLAAPPATNLRLLRRLAKVARPDLVITDVSSVKGEIVREAAPARPPRLRGRAPDGGHREAGFRRLLGRPLPRGGVVDRPRPRRARDSPRPRGGPGDGSAADHHRRRHPRPRDGLPEPRPAGRRLGAPGGGPRRRGGPTAPAAGRPGVPRHDPPRPQPASPLEGHPRREPRRGAPRPRGPGAPASRGGGRETRSHASPDEGARRARRRVPRPHRGRLQQGTGGGGPRGGGPARWPPRGPTSRSTCRRSSPSSRLPRRTPARSSKRATTPTP